MQELNYKAELHLCNLCNTLTSLVSVTGNLCVENFHLVRVIKEELWLSYLWAIALSNCGQQFHMHVSEALQIPKWNKTKSNVEPTVSHFKLLPPSVFFGGIILYSVPRDENLGIILDIFSSYPLQSTNWFIF